MKRNNVDIYVTGSNSKMLSSDVLTQFRDRGNEIHVNPLSFAEVYDLYENKESAFEHYIVYGGMPYIYSLKSDEEKNQYLKDLFRETYIKDILEIKKNYNGASFWCGNFARNQALLDNTDIMFSYKIYDSGGTIHCISLCKKQNHKLIEI